jgi:hypothetical protein
MTLTSSSSDFTQKRAAEHKLTGWVRNTDSNKVRGPQLVLYIPVSDC